MRNFKRYSTPVKFTLFVSCFALLTNSALAALEGGEFIDGNGTIEQNGSVTTITTETQDTTIFYDRFNVLEGELVNIIQPNADSHTLNYVPGNQNPITILGTLESNGQVSLVSPGGVIFGENAIVDVGALHAAAAQIGDFDNLNGLTNLSSLEGSVENYGTINAETVDLIGKNVLNAGSINASIVHLIGEKVQNTGAINAPDGMIAMIIADGTYVGHEGSRLLVNLGTSLDPGQGEIENTGTLDAEDGSVFLGAGDVYSLAIRNSGLIQAKEITLDAGDQGLVSIEEGGILDASGRQEGEVGGVIKVLGEKIGLFAGSRLDASGFAGGGKIFVGGGFQGEDPTLRNSQFTYVYVAEGATIQADALNFGNGGEIIVWADGLTRFGGFISARGGEQGGDGGLAEVSGKSALQFLNNASADLSAVAGESKGLFLYSDTMTIVDDVADTDIGDDVADTDIGDDTSNIDYLDGIDLDAVANEDSFISNDGISNLLSFGDPTLFADTNIVINTFIFGSVSSSSSIVSFKTQQLDVNGSISANVRAVFESANPESPTFVNINSGNVTMDIVGGNASDTITITGTSSLSGTIDTGSGDDRLDISSTPEINSFFGDIIMGEGNDTFTVGENVDLFVSDGSVSMGEGNDTISVNEGAELTGPVFMDGGNDTVRMQGGSSGISFESLDTGDGEDTLLLTGQLSGFDGESVESTSIYTGTGNDTIQLSETTYLISDVYTEEGNDTIVVNEGAELIGPVFMDEGNDTVRMQGGSSGISFESLDTGDGEDTILLTGTLSGLNGEPTFINTGTGNDTVRFSETTNLIGDVYTEEGNDTVQFAGTTILGTEGEGVVDTGSGDDTFVFLEAATLEGSINGGNEDQSVSDLIDTASSINANNGSSELGSGFDTLDFTASSLTNAVNPGGEGPTIIYPGETDGTTDPASVISGGFSNINQVLFLAQVLIPPITTEEPSDKSDNDDKDLAPLIERENRLIFNRIEAPIEDALIEELAKLGIYARNNTLEETLERFKGSTEFVQKIETDRPSIVDFKVAVGRTEKMHILAILEAYYELIGSEGVGPIQANLQQALERYGKDSDAMTGKGFRAYIEEHQNSELCAEALKNLNGYRKLFTKIETMGLTPRETEISKFILLRGVRRTNFSHKDLYEAIRAESEAQL